MSRKLIFQTRDSSYQVDWLSGHAGTPGFWISAAPQGTYSVSKAGLESTAPQLTAVGQTFKRNKQRVVDTCFGPVAHWTTGRRKFEGHIQGSDIDDCRSKFATLQTIVTSPYWEMIYNSGGVKETDRHYDCQMIGVAPSLYPFITWEQMEYQVDLDIEILPYVRLDGVDLPENLIIDPHLCEDWNADGVCNSFIELAQGANTFQNSIDADGGQKILVSTFGGAGGQQGIKQSAPIAVSYGQQITIQGEAKTLPPVGDGAYTIVGQLSTPQIMGINIGNEFNFDTAIPAYIADDLTFLAKYFTHLRIAMADFSSPTGISNMRSLAQQAVAAGFQVTYGITHSESTITAANWQTYHDAVIAEATWATANLSNFEFVVGNELEAMIDGSLTAEQLRSYVRQLATDVKAIAGWTAKVAYTESQGASPGSQSQGWADDNTLGGLDYLGLNVYGDDAGQDATGYYDYVTNLLKASFAANVYISEYNVFNDWGQVLANLTEDQITKALTTRRNLNAVTRMYHYTWRAPYDNFACKAQAGWLMPWFETIATPPTMILNAGVDAVGWTQYYSEGIAVPYGVTAITYAAYIQGTYNGGGGGLLSVRDAYIAVTPVDTVTGDAVLKGNDGNPVNYGSNFSTSPAHMKVKNLPGTGPAQALIKHQANAVLAQQTRYFLGAAGPYDNTIDQLVNPPCWRGYIWNFTDQASGCAYALGGKNSQDLNPGDELKIGLGHMVGRFLIHIRLASNSTTVSTDTFQVNLYPNPDMVGEAFSTIPQTPLAVANKFCWDCFGEIDLPFGSDPNWDWLAGASNVKPSNSLGVKSNGGSANSNWWVDVLELAPLNNGSQRLDPVPLLYSSERQGIIYDGISFESDVYLEHVAEEQGSFCANSGGTGGCLAYYWGTTGDFYGLIASVDLPGVPPGATLTLTTTNPAGGNPCINMDGSGGCYKGYWATLQDFNAGILSVDMPDIPWGATFAFTNGVTLEADGFPTRRLNIPQGVTSFRTTWQVSGSAALVEDGYPTRKFIMPCSASSFQCDWQLLASLAFPFDTSVAKSNPVSPRDPDIITLDAVVENVLLARAHSYVNTASDDYEPQPQRISLRVVPRIQE